MNYNNCEALTDNPCGDEDVECWDKDDRKCCRKGVTSNGVKPPKKIYQTTKFNVINGEVQENSKNVISRSIVTTIGENVDIEYV